MDRLISENAVMEVLIDMFVDNKVTIEVFKNMGLAIKAIPPTYKGMTNGEVIKMLYPQGEIVKGLYGISGNPLICVNLNISKECSEMVFTEDWWNSPYEPQESEDKE